MEHTREPWRLPKGDEAPDMMIVCAEDGSSICDCSPGNPYMTLQEAEANARRIVACVNACDGIPTEVLESGYIVGMGTDEMIWVATNKLFGEKKEEVHDDA